MLIVMNMVNFDYFDTGPLALAMALWVSNPSGLKDSMVPFLVVEDPFFLPVKVPLLLVGKVDLLVLSLPDNVWTQAMEKLEKWRGNVPAQGILNIIALQAEHLDHCKHFRQGEHCICVGNGLAMSALYPEMRSHKNQTS